MFKYGEQFCQKQYFQPWMQIESNRNWFLTEPSPIFDMNDENK